VVEEETDRSDHVEGGGERAALVQKGLGPSYGEVSASAADHRLPAAGEKEEEETDDLCPTTAKYYPFLDVTRICCVGLVCVDHGDPEFAKWNVILVQGWVLQFLFLVCGVCYGMSKKSLLGYELRLLKYAILGICINWSAWLLMGMDWKHNFFNVVFHIWFIFGIMLYALILYPLRIYLAKVREQSDSQGYILSSEIEQSPSQDDDSVEKAITVRRRAQDRDSWVWAIAVILGGVLALLVLFHVVVQPLLLLLAPLFLNFIKAFGTGASFWGLPEDIDETYIFLQRICQYINASVTNIYLIVACTKMFKRRQIAAWIVIAHTYLNRCLFYRAADERAFHGLDLTVIALSVYYLGLLHRRKLGEYLVRYWFCLIVAVIPIWPMGTYGRFDENPPKDMNMRIRYNLMEAIAVLTWFLAADRVFDIKICSEDKLDFMNDWALLAFLVHKAIHIMFPEPLNWIVIIALAPACYFRKHYT